MILPVLASLFTSVHLGEQRSKGWRWLKGQGWQWNPGGGAHPGRHPVSTQPEAKWVAQHCGYPDPAPGCRTWCRGRPGPGSWSVAARAVRMAGVKASGESLSRKDSRTGAIYNPVLSVLGCEQSRLRTEGTGVGRCGRDAGDPSRSARGASRPCWPARPGRQGRLRNWSPGGKRVNTGPRGGPWGMIAKRDTKNKSNQRAAPPPPGVVSAGGATRPAASARARAPRASGAQGEPQPGPGRPRPRLGAGRRSAPRPPAPPGRAPRAG